MHLFSENNYQYYFGKYVGLHKDSEKIDKIKNMQQLHVCRTAMHEINTVQAHKHTVSS